MSKVGVIYILTNPAFPQYVKIGYADDLDRRLRDLNRSECIPFAFRVYATYEVNSRLSDLKIHSIIDKLNPNLRAIENFNGKKRVREFYAMSAEDAYSILEAIAEIHGASDSLKLVGMNEAQRAEEDEAEDISAEHWESQRAIGPAPQGQGSEPKEHRMNLAIASEVYQIIRKNSIRNAMTYVEYISSLLQQYRDHRQGAGFSKTEEFYSYVEATGTQGIKGQKSPRMNLLFEPTFHELIRNESKEWGLTYSQFVCAVVRMYGNK